MLVTWTPLVFSNQFTELDLVLSEQASEHTVLRTCARVRRDGTGRPLVLLKLRHHVYKWFL